MNAHQDIDQDFQNELTVSIETLHQGLVELCKNYINDCWIRNTYSPAAHELIKLLDTICHPDNTDQSKKLILLITIAKSFNSYISSQKSARLKLAMHDFMEAHGLSAYAESITLSMLIDDVMEEMIQDFRQYYLNAKFTATLREEILHNLNNVYDNRFNYAFMDDWNASQEYRHKNTTYTPKLLMKNLMSTMPIKNEVLMDLLKYVKGIVLPEVKLFDCKELSRTKKYKFDNVEPQVTINGIANEMWLKVFSYLDLNGLTCMIISCKQMAHIANDKGTRERLYLLKEDKAKMKSVFQFFALPQDDNNELRQMAVGLNVDKCRNI